jgi:tRNA G18 (ribose-2'-O)-methylase SpoU
MHRENVTDAADPRLSEYRALTDVQLRRRREPEEGLYIAESEKVLRRALAAGHRPRSILAQERWLAGLENLPGVEDVPVYVVDEDLAQQVTGYRVHRGVLASMHRPTLPDPKQVLSRGRTFVVLEDLVDHANVGAAFRSVAALGADGVLVTPRCADPLYRRSVRVSMGAVFEVPWTRLPPWPQARALFRDAGIPVAALALEKDAHSLEDFAAVRPERLAVALGTEGAGLSGPARAAADYVVRIPMAAGIDSLNVGAAAAVALWALQHPSAPPRV